MKDIKISHIRREPISPILPKRGLWGPEYQKSPTWVTFGTPQAPLGQNRQNRLCTYVRNFDIFHLRPVPSKNIENCALENFLKFRISKIKFFTPMGIPRKRKTVEIFISEIYRNHAHGHFKPSHV